MIFYSLLNTRNSLNKVLNNELRYLIRAARA